MNRTTSRQYRTLVAILAVATPGWATADAVTLPSVTAYLPSNTGIVIVDANQNRRIGTITGTDSVHGLAITPDGRTLIAGSLLARAQGAPMPKPTAVSASDHAAHHKATPSAKDTIGTLYLVDVAKREITRRIDVPGAIHHTLVTPDGKYAVSTHPGLGGVSVVSLASAEVTQLIETGQAPDYAISNQDGSRLYVSNSGDGTVTEIDTVLWKPVRQFAVGGSPGHIALAADEATLFMVDVTGNDVAALDLASARVKWRFPAGTKPHGIDLSDDGSTLYVSSLQSNELRAIDPVNGDTRLLALKPAPYHVSAIRGTGKLYVSSKASPQVWIINQQTLQIDEIIQTDGVTHQMVSWKERPTMSPK